MKYILVDYKYVIQCEDDELEKTKERIWLNLTKNTEIIVEDNPEELMKYGYTDKLNRWRYENDHDLEQIQIMHRHQYHEFKVDGKDNKCYVCRDMLKKDYDGETVQVVNGSTTFHERDWELLDAFGRMKAKAGELKIKDPYIMYDRGREREFEKGNEGRFFIDVFLLSDFEMVLVQSGKWDEEWFERKVLAKERIFT